MGMNEKLQRWINWIQYDELIAGKNNNPKKLLGLHDYYKGQVVTAYKPHAVSVKVMSSTGKNVMEMEPVGENGFFGLYLPKKVYKNYVFETTYEDGSTVTLADPYVFEPQISDMDIYLFAEGKHYEIYEKLGAHPMKLNGVEGTYFAVWAPNARRVSVVGDFNMWDGALHPMNMMGSSGIHELFIPGVKEGAVYKFQILTRFDELIYKADPYGNCCQFRPDNASVVVDLSKHKWKDAAWIEKRQNTHRTDSLRKPMAIYEMHLGSWKKAVEDSDNGFYSYRELAPMIADYIKEMGYTHIELMGIAEYPFDGSWGYQVTNYYAPTRRYGLPEDFMYFVDYMHKNGIYVILDWVPAHFPKDAHGLGRFDGMPLYEHPDPRRGEHPDWGTYIFDYSRNEVQNFLVANALFWLEKFHIDGLRVDAVASMLYLDYGKRDGEWLPNKNGGKENLDAIAFMQHLNRMVEERVPGALMIAEESTSWAGVTAPVSMDGLGYLYKWNMGWMNDFLEYMKLDPYFRSFNHNRLTFSLMYTYSENFILVISHDEVVHLKCSMLLKMPGTMPEKFANLKTAYGFMYAHPGKKLLFMGQEFGQEREWSEARSLDWYVLDQPGHQGLQSFVKKLNALYKKYDAFYYNDCDQMGFEWINCNDNEHSQVSFIRRGSTAKDQLLFVCNFTPVERENFWVGVPCLGSYTEILNSDAEEFEGEGRVNKKPLQAIPGSCDGKEQYISFTLPPLSVVVFKYDYVDNKVYLEKQAEEKAAKKAKTAAKKAPAKKTVAKAATAEKKVVDKKASADKAETAGSKAKK
ncbi:MAG: 1,4-alpha-glucan branching protein GlgB [Clostridium sp.]|nr:1,4-alpha-glucan branching protein GlgB [Clostridium sp.]